MPGSWWIGDGEIELLIRFLRSIGDVPRVELPGDPVHGKVLYAEQNCAACHGAKAEGSDNGPPLVHKIYESSHHADFAFQMAAKGGVRAHHWRFGDMPPVPGVTEKQVEWIVTYVREIQRENGIN